MGQGLYAGPVLSSCSFNRKPQNIVSEIIGAHHHTISTAGYFGAIVTLPYWHPGRVLSGIYIDIKVWAQ